MADHTDGERQSPRGYRSMPPSRNLYCTHCKEGITPDKRLYSCAACHRPYHPACYGLTLPGKPIDSPNWTCRRCLEKRVRRESRRRMGTTRLRDHESKSVSSYGNTATGLTSAASPSQRKRNDMAPGSSPSVNRDGSVSTCTYLKCPSKAEPSSGFCMLHSSKTSGEASHETTKARLLPENGLENLLPMTRRKTGHTGLGPFPKARTNGSSTQKVAREPPSPSDNAGENGPARKRPRIDESLTESTTKTDPVFKKPWDTSFNPRSRTKTGADKTANGIETRGKSYKLSADKTQRKFAPKIGLAFKPLVVNGAGSEQSSRSISDSPAPPANGSAPTATSFSTASPFSSGNRFVATGNASLKEWFQRRESSVPEQPNLGDRGSSLLPAKSFDEPPSAGSTPSISTPSVSEGRQRQMEASSWMLPQSLIDNSPKRSPSGLLFQRQISQPPLKQSTASTPAAAVAASKPLAVSLQHLDGWQLPAPDKSKGRTVSDLDFDSLIYGQEGAAPPPRGVTVDPQKALKRPPPKKQPVPPDEPYYAHIDPRVHWPQVHSDEWYEKKMQEIQARGGRKANFGKAAERMRERRLREGAISWEDTLPEKIRQNPAWVRALRELRKQHEQPQKNSPRKRGKPGPKPKGLKRETSGPKTPRKSTGMTYRQHQRYLGLESSDSE